MTIPGVARKPLVSRILDAAHVTTVAALIGTAGYLFYKIFDVLGAHKKVMRMEIERSRQLSNLPSSNANESATPQPST